MPAFLRLLGLWALLAGQGGWAYSPESEAVLEKLRDKVSAGLAGQESYDAFLDLLSEGGDGGCEAWADMPEARDGEARWRDVQAVMDEVCPDAARPGGAAGPGNLQDTLGNVAKGRDSRARLLIVQTARPRQSPEAKSTAPAPLIRGEGAAPGVSGLLSLRDYRPDLRYLRVGARRLSLHAGHLHASLGETRLGFVAGSRFYAGWSGTSGVDGALFSPQAALDGLGLSAQAGAWTLEAAGTWNRLMHAGGDLHPQRRDAILYAAGFARRIGGGGKDGFDFRMQAALQRFEPGEAGGDIGDAAATPTEVAVAGTELGNRRDGLLGKLGLAASSIRTGQKTGDEFFSRPGAYLEASLASPRAETGSWRLQAHQASEAWANPLQSPRGYLRDTLDGQWILPGRGEGGFSARTGFPLARAKAYRADLQGGGASGWSLDRGMLAGEGSLSVTQALGDWTHEAGATLAFLRPSVPNRNGSAGRGGWGQSLAWKHDSWSAKAALSWRGGGYSGPRPLPFSLALDRTGLTSWGAEILTGDVSHPWDYLRLDLHQGWKAERRVRVEHALRMPWSPSGGMGSDMGYQLRLEATL